MKQVLPETGNQFSLKGSEMTNAPGLWRPLARSGWVPAANRFTDLPSVYHTRQGRGRSSGPLSRSFPHPVGLRNDGGRVVSAGWDKLREEIWTSVEGWLDQDEDAIRGGTPIEKLFFSALTWYTKLAGTSYQPVYQWTPDEYRASFAFNPVSPPLLVKPQVQLPFGRVDFVVWAEEIATRQYRRLIVECDGHDYHERTKEQAAKDRSRDREAVLAGYDVFRFTGSELWRDPWGCAEKVQIWAERGLP